MESYGNTSMKRLTAFVSRSPGGISGRFDHAQRAPFEPESALSGGRRLVSERRPTLNPRPNRLVDFGDGSVRLLGVPLDVAWGFRRVFGCRFWG
jgi:hypothetical protein